MDPLFAIGLFLVLALLAGQVVRVLRVPEVTAYILVGVALGPSVLAWISARNVASLHVMSEVALGLILFSVGSVFSLSHFRHIGRRVVMLTLMESATTGSLVFTTTLFLGQRWQMAALLGTVAMSTAPAATLMVLRECNSRGPLTDTLRGVVAVNKLVVLATFTLVVALIRLTQPNSGASTLTVIYDSAFTLVWELAGSVALGFLIGLLLAGWCSRIKDYGEVQMLLAGCILLCVGAALLLELSPLLASLAVGATMVNLTPTSQRLTAALSRLDPPFYAIFFVVAGADLDIGRVRTLGALGGVYILSRAAGKCFGSRIGANLLGFEPLHQRSIGLALLAQADLALGLSLDVARRFPEYAGTMSTVVLGAVCVFEVLGPVMTRYAVLASGEARLKSGGIAGVWEQP
jgi:Kef-type K+ transport system membrane component KefB